MMGHTHWIIGGASWLGALSAANVAGNAPLSLGMVAGGFAIASVAALCPDIDTKKSMAAKSLGPVTGILSWIIRTIGNGHRKITHCLLGASLVILGLAFCVGSLHLIPWIGFAVVIGWISHIVADMLTKEGCPLLWPISKVKFGLHIVTTGGKLEKYFIRPVTVLAVIGFSVLLVMGMLWICLSHLT